MTESGTVGLRLCWTVVATGPKVADWGFFCGHGLVCAVVGAVWMIGQVIGGGGVDDLRLDIGCRRRLYVSTDTATATAMTGVRDMARTPRRARLEGYSHL
jgi:hypothetical protein